MVRARRSRVAEPKEHADHFESIERQVRAATLGMWVFIASEALFFAALFALYGAYRADLPRAFSQGIEHNDLALGTTNTVLLLTSSLTLALAVVHLQRGKTSNAALLSGGTAMLGLAFLGVKTVEYLHHFESGVFPGGRGAYFDAHSVDGAAIFFNLYYLATGLHALHVIVGVLLVASVTLLLMRRGDLRVRHRAEVIALYWHFVDVVWLFLWPMFYLSRGGAQ